MRGLAALLAVLMLAGSPAAASTLAEARALLDRAGVALSAARGDEARLAAVSRAIDAHERALAALRTALRSIAREEQALRATLSAERERLGALISALQSLSRAPRLAILAYPGGPVRAARAGSLVAAVTPEIEGRIAVLRERLGRLEDLTRAETEARETLTETLAGLQQLRAQGTRALRRKRPVASGAEIAAAAKAAGARAKDLRALARLLKARLGPQLSTERFSDRAGRLDLPVAGRIAAGFGAPDPWGRPGSGLSLTAPAYAQVTAPADATLRFAGPLPGFGRVVVLEPEEGWLMVLAGLGRIERQPGETVLAGERLGDLGGPLPSDEEFLREAAHGDGQIAEETLYVEIRQEGRAVDPAAWFRKSRK